MGMGYLFLGWRVLGWVFFWEVLETGYVFLVVLDVGGQD